MNSGRSTTLGMKSPSLTPGNSELPVGDARALHDVGCELTAIGRLDVSQTRAQQIVGNGGRHGLTADPKMIEARQRSGFAQCGVDVQITAERALLNLRSLAGAWCPA